MNAQQTKEFAAANGFVITTVGRRYVATHTSTGHAVERGGYAALYNAMVDTVNLVKRGLLTPQKAEPGVNGNQHKIDERAALDADAASWEAASKRNDDPFSAKNMVAIRELSAQELRTKLTLAAGVELDAIAAAFNIDARLAGACDAVYRNFVKNTLTARELSNRISNAPRLQEVLRERFKPRARRVTHIVLVRYKDGALAQIDAHSYDEAIKATRRECSGANHARVKTIEMLRVA